MKKWLLIGIILRLVIAAITFHPDTHFFVFTNYLLVAKQLWLGIYDYAGSSLDPLANAQPPTAFTYPPLIFLINGLWANLTYRLQDLTFVKSFILDYGAQLGDARTFWLLFLTKLPYLLPDILLGYLLSRLTTRNEKRETGNAKLAFKIWLLNPITIYATFAIGQFDIYPTLAVVIALWFVIAKKQSYWAAAALGFGGAFKMFPLLLLPILALHQGKSLLQKSLLFFTGFVAYLIPLIPYLPSPGFRAYALLAPQAEKFLFAKIPLTGAEYLSIFFVIYTLILIWSVYKTQPLWHYFLAVLLLFFSVTHFHPQWFIWISPLLILYLVSYPAQRWLVYTLLFCYLAIILSFESSLNYALIAPLIHSLNNTPPLTAYLPLALDYHLYLSIIRSIFAGTALYLSFRLFTKQETG